MRRTSSGSSAGSGSLRSGPPSPTSADSRSPTSSTNSTIGPGATNGNAKALEITIRYVDGSTEVVKDLFVHERGKLTAKGTDNPYVEFLLSPNQWVWYRYRLVNPRPDKEALNVTFKNTNVKSTVRVADAIQLRTRIKQLS